MRGGVLLSLVGFWGTDVSWPAPLEAVGFTYLQALAMGGGGCGFRGENAYNLGNWRFGWAGFGR